MEKSRNYKFVDEPMLARASRAIRTLVQFMNQCNTDGATWEKDWLCDFTQLHLDKIKGSTFDKVCDELGFEKVERNIIGVKPYYAVSDDEAVIARVETRKRLKHLDRLHKMLGMNNEFPYLGGWLTVHTEISRYFKDMIQVDKNGKASLPKDYESQLRELCTKEIPERWRFMCDLLRDNEKVFMNFESACDDRPMLRQAPPYYRVYKNGKFSIEEFGKYIGL